MLCVSCREYNSSYLDVLFTVYFGLTEKTGNIYTNGNKKYNDNTIKRGDLLRGKETAFVVNKGNHALPYFHRLSQAG